MRARCIECGDDLTRDEKQFYEVRCEYCEGLWFERMEAWRRGGKDPELDTMFGGIPIRLQ